ncbi:MAG TPA: hypothetical protein VJ201_01975, partial [Candidatus Babeliales bacterium]|nr:hypothetical protein [Candidatus Babeliales bacterium]
MKLNIILIFFAIFNIQIGAENFKLITVLYNEKNPARTKEYLTCLNHNLNHELIDTILVIYDTSADDQNNTILNYLKTKKVTISYANSRQTYGYCFELANKLYPNSKIILSNADIYFNETLNLLRDYDLTGQFLALTRWNITKDNSLELFKQYPRGKFNKDWSESSQDVWIFKTPLHITKAIQIQLGIMNCDSRIAYEAFQSGLKVTNPCLTIQCCHLHRTNIRN